MHMSFGVAACYRGPGLSDTPIVKDMVASWVGWFKQHRRILTSDIIHIRRPDGQSSDSVQNQYIMSSDCFCISLLYTDFFLEQALMGLFM